MALSQDLDDYKLEAEINRSLNLVVHRHERADWARGLRKVVVEEKWSMREGVLGAGSFGTVHLQRRQTVNKGSRLKERAVKQLRKSDMERTQVDFRKELLALVKFSRAKFVQSQAFVEFLGWYEEDDYIHIAMEYFSHGTLDKFIGESMSERDAQLIAQQLLVGLRIMHEEHFAHRDLKPQNIFVAQPGPHWWVKIGDFGVSKRVSNHSTALRTTIGTPLYLAPEVFHYVPLLDDEGESYTNAVDVWSFACVVYQMLALRPPFVGWPGHLVAFCNGGAFPEESLKSRASPEAIGFIKSVLVAYPENRPSAKEALEASWLQIHIPAEAPTYTMAPPTAIKKHHATDDKTIKPLAGVTQSLAGFGDEKADSMRTIRKLSPLPRPEKKESLEFYRQPESGERRIERPIQLSPPAIRKPSPLPHHKKAPPSRPGHCWTCSKPYTGDYYRCSICADNYDLCVTCVESGRHCRHEDHWLVKRNTERGNMIGLPTQTFKSGWALQPLPGAKEEERPASPPDLESSGWRSSYPRLHRSQTAYDYCYQCRVTFPADNPPHRHQWELHGTVDRPVMKPDSLAALKKPAQPTRAWIRDVDPEEQEQHRIKMAKLESEMETVFLAKSKEKYESIARNEEELYARHRAMKEAMERQLLEMKEKRLRLLNFKPDEKPAKRRGFSLR